MAEGPDSGSCLSPIPMLLAIGGICVRVLITEDLWLPIPEDFRQDLDVVYDPDLFARPDKLATYAEGTVALIVRNKTRVNRELLDRFTSLRVIGRLGVGLDNLDLEACRQRGVRVVAAKGFNANAVAEYVFAAMFLRARFLHSSDAATKRGKWDRRGATGAEISGKRLGLIGVGEIGQRVAFRARAMGMKVFAYDPFLLTSNQLIQDSVVCPVELVDLLRQSDYISMHVPLMPATHHLIGAKELQVMKDDVMLINTSRGGIIDETALVASLREHPGRFAALDVRETEPAGEGDEMCELSNVLLTPHIAGITHESSAGVANFILQQVQNLLQGRPVGGLVI